MTTQTRTTPPRAATGPRTQTWIYLGLALSMSVTAFWGFSYTYFMPVLAGAYPAVSPAVHVHGWSFFLWFLLLPLQPLLMATGRRRAHVTLGGASVALAVVMAFTGILVASVRINEGLFATEPDELTVFWKEFGQLIMYNMILFVGFYGTAIARRDQPDVHKRMMVLAAPACSRPPSSDHRRPYGSLLARNAWMGDAGRVLPPGRVYRCRHGPRPPRQGGIHRAYLVGLPVFLVVHGLGLIMAGTAAGETVSRIMALFAQVFGALY